MSAYPGKELASLDFESLIGGPLVAIINAQAQAAMSTVNFIKTVGFKPPQQAETDFEAQATNEPVYVTFKYAKEVSPYQPEVGDPNNPVGPPAYKKAVGAVVEMQVLEVPLLTIVPIPFIRIESATIDFNAKITSVEYRKTDSSLKVGAEATVGTGRLTNLVGSVKLKVSTSFQRSTTEGINVERTYSMSVHVRAVQEEMPAGMERILGILEEAIRGHPEKAPAPTTT